MACIGNCIDTAIVHGVAGNFKRLMRVIIQEINNKPSLKWTVAQSAFGQTCYILLLPFNEHQRHSDKMFGIIHGIKSAAVFDEGFLVYISFIFLLQIQFGNA